MKSERTLEFPRGPWLERLVAHSLEEDVGPGDASTAVAVDPRQQARALVVPRSGGVTAGLPLLAMVYGKLDPGVGVELMTADGEAVPAGRAVAALSGPAAAILTGERTALNFLQYLGGIATQTAAYAAAVEGTGCLVLDTRKTLPGYRALAKYAVRCGGGRNHRLGLYDRIMIKDNHWASRRGNLAAVVARARREFPALAVEIEVDDLEQFARILPLQVEWVLLDNFPVQDVSRAVALRDEAGAATRLEASGNLTLETVGEYARSGVDAVSVGRLTHSVTAWDLGLDFEPADGGRR